VTLGPVHERRVFRAGRQRRGEAPARVRLMDRRGPSARRLHPQVGAGYPRAARGRHASRRRKLVFEDEGHGSLLARLEIDSHRLAPAALDGCFDLDSAGGQAAKAEAALRVRAQLLRKIQERTDHHECPVHAPLAVHDVPVSVVSTRSMSITASPDSSGSTGTRLIWRAMGGSRDSMPTTQSPGCGSTPEKAPSASVSKGIPTGPSRPPKTTVPLTGSARQAHASADPDQAKLDQQRTRLGVQLHARDVPARRAVPQLQEYRPRPMASRRVVPASSIKRSEEEPETEPGGSA